VGCGDHSTRYKSGSEPPQDINSLIHQFKNPPVEYSPAPFWVWNDSITREKIEDQLIDFKNKGIHQVFIHPRPGLITEYLSTNWYELCAHAVRKGKELNMKIWLYDENSFPSGFAGGHVPASLPPDADPVAGLRMHKLDKLDISDNNDYMIVLKRIGNSFANITNGIDNYLKQPGDYYGFSKWYYPDDQGLFGGFSYVDLLAYGITEKFIRTTMRGYEEYIGEEFGQTVMGIFTDEPHIHTTADPEVVKFTPVLFNRFEKKYGYPLANYLPCLFEQVGDWKNVRHDYYALLLDMFIERWAKPWKIYTDSNNLKWTGHYWEHMWPNPEYVADNMAIYAWHHYPGIDMLFNNEIRRPDQFGNVRAVRELASIANQLGKERTLSETYGASGWDLSFSDIKRLGDWEYALGVNMMNQHLSYMTLKGARKRDFPLSFSYHAPWWDQYGILNEYFHRLSYALTSGKQINKILVIEPTSTAWMYFSPDQGVKGIGVKGKIKIIEKSFRAFIDLLEKYQVEYDLGSEKILAEFGREDNGWLQVGQRNYSLVLFPPSLENLEKPTFDLLKNYLKNGGRIISFNEIPSHIDGNLSRTAKNTFAGFKNNIIYKDSLDSSTIQKYLLSEKFIPVEPEKWDGRVFHHRRELQEGSLLFIANFDSLQTASIRFKSKGKSVIELDLLSGEVFNFPALWEEDQIIVNLTLPPANSKLLFISDKNQNYPARKIIDQEKLKMIPSADTRIVKNGLNALTLDYCDIKVKNRILKDIYFYQAADTIFKEYLGEIYGFNFNPWSVAIQYRTNILDKNADFANSPGYTADFSFFVADGFKPTQIRAVVENPDIYDVKFNDHTVNPIENQWWLDRDFGVYELTPAVLNARNILTLSVKPMNILAELEPVYIIGNFSVYPIEKGWEITEPENPDFGSWKEMGMPFYSSSVSYTKNIELDKESLKHLMVKLTSWKGSVAEVIVNNKHAGIIAWPPYQLNITDWIKDGNNKVDIRIFGSLKNLLGPHHNNPIDGFVTPWSFFYAPLQQPPGEKYDLNHYGLFKDFEIAGY
jgi:hypothetical protein